MMIKFDIVFWSVLLSKTQIHITCIRIYIYTHIVPHIIFTYINLLMNIFVPHIIFTYINLLMLFMHAIHVLTCINLIYYHEYMHTYTHTHVHII